jgi:hypothetical protein
MDARWVPVLAAFVGLIGGLGGAYIGGSVANKGQHQQFKDERKAATADLRRATYANYLQVADTLAVRLEIRREIGQGALPPEKVVPLIRAAAAVALSTDKEQVRAAADEMTRALAGGKTPDYSTPRDRFVSLATQEIGTTSP